MLAIAMAQVLLVLNVTTLKVSVEGITESYDASASLVETMIVMYSVAVAALIIVGGRIDEIFGARRMFRAATMLFAVAMAAMALSTGPLSMIIAQTLAGAATGALLPALVMLIGRNYRGAQETWAIGWLSAAEAMSIVPAILLAGLLATWPGWRFTYGVLVLLALAVCWLGRTAVADLHRTRVRIDVAGLLLATTAIVLIGIGFTSLYDWGVWRATRGAPFGLFGVSPAPIAIAGGVLLAKGFLIWSRRHQAAGGTPLVPLEAFAGSGQRAALLSIFLTAVIGSAITYVVPLYVEIVQGRTALHTAVALLPFAVATFAAAVLVVRISAVVRPGRVAGAAFLAVALGSALLGVTIRNDWSDLLVVVGMAVTGLGQGALGTLLFKLLATNVRRRPEADLTPLCGSAEYLAAAIGTALSSAVVVGVLAGGVQRELADNVYIPEALRAQLDLDSPSFVSNDRLRDVLSRMDATPAQIAEAVRINTAARLDALRVCFFVLAAFAALALMPVRRLSDRSPP